MMTTAMTPDYETVRDAVTSQEPKLPFPVPDEADMEREWRHKFVRIVVESVRNQRLQLEQGEQS